MNICKTCGIPDRLKPCPGCNNVKYCSIFCRKVDLKNHQEFCIFRDLAAEEVIRQLEYRIECLEKENEEMRRAMETDTDEE